MIVFSQSCEILRNRAQNKRFSHLNITRKCYGRFFIVLLKSIHIPYVHMCYIQDQPQPSLFCEKWKIKEQLRGLTISRFIYLTSFHVGSLASLKCLMMAPHFSNSTLVSLKYLLVAPPYPSVTTVSLNGSTGNLFQLQYLLVVPLLPLCHPLIP